MSLDPLNRTITAVVGAVLVVVSVALAASPARPVAMPAMALAGIVLAAAWAMAPSAVEIDGGVVRIRRRAWQPLEIPVASIASVETMPRLGLGLRLFGVGGFFGSYGLFWTRPLGRFRAYVTRKGTNVLLRRRDGALAVLVTPDDADGFATALRVATGQRA